MKKYLYFAYGMNTNLDGMARRCPKAKPLGYAQLPDYAFRFAGPADVVQKNHSTVNGVLWLITKDCLKSLDMLEGYPHFYDRKYVKVLINGKVKYALTYYMQPGHTTSHPSDSYLNCLLEGYFDNLVPTEQLYTAIEECNTQVVQKIGCEEIQTVV